MAMQACIVSRRGRRVKQVEPQHIDVRPTETREGRVALVEEDKRNSRRRLT